MNNFHVILISAYYLFDCLVFKILLLVLSQLAYCVVEFWAVINNAGILGCISETEWTPISAYKNVMDVNLLGTVRVTSACIPLLRSSAGRIVTVASVAGKTTKHYYYY